LSSRRSWRIAPRPDDVPTERRDDALGARNLIIALKDGRAIGEPPETVASRVARSLRAQPEFDSIFGTFFSASPTLVPVPRSTLPTRDGLWVPDQLCHALRGQGLGAEVAPLLERSEPIPKAARSLSVDRPTASRHYETLRARPGLSAPTEILLVDDVVTAGATLLGSASRLAEAFPDVPIRAFAAVRTISLGGEFRRTSDPVRGTIVLRPSGRTQREP
jgi:hypothetical protein